ncbi:MAG: glutamyl-tRNA reductase [Planctomycetota bacterium]
MLGCSHTNAAVQFRERLAFTPQQAQAAMQAFGERFPTSELVLLSTCNRVELYAASVDANSPPDRDQMIQFLSTQRDLPVDTLMDQLIYRNGEQAIKHLFTVASSLDSMVVGEAQISSQVKQAYKRAQETGAAGPLSHAAFAAANRAAKRVQTETTIHERRISVPSVAVGEVVPEFFESLRDKRVLLIGAGEMGQETLRYLRDAGASNLTILNRTLETAREIAAEVGAVAADWETLSRQITDAHLVVSTTSAPQPIIDADQFTDIHNQRRGRTLLILDLAVPRDFHPTVGEFTGVYLYSVDDLQSACERNRRERQKEWPAAEQIISEETTRFFADLNHRSTGPVIKRLRQQAGEIRDAEWQRLRARLTAKGVEASDIKAVEKTLDRIVNKLLHPPLASLKEDAAEGHPQGLLAALRQLFRLDDE